MLPVPEHVPVGCSVLPLPEHVGCGVLPVPEHVGCGVLLLPLVGPGRLGLLVLHADLIVAEEAVLPGKGSLEKSTVLCGVTHFHSWAQLTNNVASANR